MEFSKDIENLKSLILEKEHIENILVFTGNSYHVVGGSVIDFDEDYIFHFEGFSFNLEINEIKSFILIE